MRLVVAVSLLHGLTGSAWAQEPASSAAPAPSSPLLTRPVAQDIVALPTTASLDRFQSYFRLTHRFTRDLRGPLADLAKSAFGLDDGAIQIFARHDTVRQSERMPFAASIIASIEGTNNLRAQHSQAAGLVLSRTFRDRLGLYVSPVMVWNSQSPAGVTGTEGPVEHERTFHAGIGARLRLRSTVFVAAEFIPRTGFTPGAHQWGAGLEKRTDGHQFQLNVSNSFGTTLAQIARGGQPGNVHLGFNLGRRF